MKGNIQTSEKCPICGGVLRHSEDRSAFVCGAEQDRLKRERKTGKKTRSSIKDHSEETFNPKKLRVKFGRDVSKRFDNYKEATQFLAGLRYKTVEGTFDKRDYLKDNPMGFANQAEKYKTLKREKTKPRSYDSIKRYINRAIDTWGQRNVKTIGYGDIEDFIYSYGDISDKTRSNILSTIHDFFTWVCKRERMEMPEFPEIKYELGWRNIVSLEAQDQIIEEIERICPIHRVVLGIKWLANYVAIRPSEMLNLRERDIDVNGFFVIPQPKEKKPKMVPMHDEDIKLFRSMPKGMPDLFFFRHFENWNGATVGKRHDRKLWNRWWKKACNNLGVKDVCMYGGTRHSSASALSDQFTRDDIKQFATMHGSDKAFDRYCQGERKGKIEMVNAIRDFRHKRKAEVINLDKINDDTP